jgi:D-alanine-D-alanine ligase
LLQEFLNVTEVTIGVIETGNKIQALAPLVVSNKGISDVQYKRKSAITDKCIFIENNNLVKKVQNIAELIFAEFGCRDTARIDFRIDANENIYFIEINPLTDYTPRKDFCKSAFACGLGYEQLLQTIIFNAWNRSQK